MQRYPILNLTRKVFSSNNFPIVSCNQEIRNSLLQRIRKVLLNKIIISISFLKLRLRESPFSCPLIKSWKVYMYVCMLQNNGVSRE